MQTNFTAEQRQSRSIQEADSILRKCVHCGFCTATCPTFVLLGDELDSPRGRIYLIKDMLENDKPASAKVVKHIDRCLTCLSCMTTCPSGVDYNHLVEQAREHIEATHVRPLPDRLMRGLISKVLPYTGRFRLMMRLGKLGRPFAGLLPGRLQGMVKSIPQTVHGSTPANRPGRFPAAGVRRKRVAMLTGCVQPALDPEINESTVRLLTRLGVEVVVPRGQGCCGAIVQHMGDAEGGRAFAKANINAWLAEADGDGLDAIVINASGCGSMIKDYGHMFAADPDMSGPAARVAGLAKDITEILADLEITPREQTTDVVVAYHPPCSLQHGQRVRDLPRQLLESCGFTVHLPLESHLCCGSAGTYSMFQPDLSNRLQARKTANLEALKPTVVATGNIGCLTHIAEATHLPVVHTLQLIDWATGGPKPKGME